jgi:hypothetical protein
LTDGDLECAFDEDLEWLFNDDEDDLEGDLECSFDLDPDPSLECPAALGLPLPFIGPK